MNTFAILRSFDLLSLSCLVMAACSFFLEAKLKPLNIQTEVPLPPLLGLFEQLSAPPPPYDLLELSNSW